MRNLAVHPPSEGARRAPGLVEEPDTRFEALGHSPVGNARERVSRQLQLAEEVC